MPVTPFLVQIFLSVEKKRQCQQDNDEDFPQPHSQGSVLYQEWRNLFFHCFTIFVRKGVIFLFQWFSSSKQNPHKKITVLIRPLQHSRRLHLPWCSLTSHNTAHAYNKGSPEMWYSALRKMRTCKQLKCVNIRQVVNVIASNVMQFLLPWCLYYIMSLLTAHALTNGQRKAWSSWLTTPVMGWLELAFDAFSNWFSCVPVYGMSTTEPRK
jgi:hypothetical protein